MTRERIHTLDLLRGGALLGMILHHTLFAVEEVSALFGWEISFWFLNTWVFWALQELFVAVFLLVSGICTAFSRSPLRRGLIVCTAAALITLLTGGILPLFGILDLQIWFGILHMIGLSMVLYALLSHQNRLVRAGTAGALFVLYLTWVTCRQAVWAKTLLLLIGWPQKGFYSADYYPLLPYFLIFLAGAFLGPLVKEHRFPKGFYRWRARPVEFLGRYSIWVYLLHQPLIFGVCALVFWLIGLR